MRTYVGLTAFVALCAILAVGSLVASISGCSPGGLQDVLPGPADDVNSDEGLDEGTGDGSGNDSNAPGDDSGQVDAPGDDSGQIDDPGDTDPTGDATCVRVTSAEAETGLTCATGPCGQIQWQNDCGESVVVILLDADRENVLQIMGMTPGGIGVAIIDPEDWSANMAYGIVEGTDSVECSADAGCSVSDLVDRGLLDLDRLIVVDIS